MSHLGLLNFSVLRVGESRDASWELEQIFHLPLFFFFGSFAGLSRFGRSGTLFDRGDISGSFTDLSLLLNLLFSFSV